MKTQSRFGIVITLFFLCVVPPFASAQTRGGTLNRLSIRGSEKGIEVQATASQPVTTEAQVLTGPDRLVVDFPGVVPGSQVRNLIVNQGGIKSVRVGLFQSNPPVTRVVLDLTTPSPYQLLPDGNSVTVKLGQSSPVAAKSPSAQIVNSASVKLERWPVGQASVTTPAPPKNVQVSFRDGLLSIAADKASLAEVLYEIHLRTGADIPIPAGAEREKVIVKTGPAPANQAMATLLNGTSFNFVVVGSEQDPKALRSVILSPRGTEGVSQPIAQPIPQEPVAEAPPPPIDIPPENVPDTPQVEEGPPPGQLQPGQENPQGQAVPQLAAPTAPPAPPMQPDPNAAPLPPEPPPD
jgi:AMIN domain